MSDKELESKLKRVAKDCNPKVKQGWVCLEGDVTNKSQMEQMDAAIKLVEGDNRKE